MPSISDKLKDLGVHVGTSTIKSAKKSLPSSALIETLQGAWEKTSQGDCFVVRKEFPLTLQHGNRNLGQLPQINIFESLKSLSGISKIPIDQFLFIDTETTGLSGGAGTYVFLVGAAKIEKDKINFAQFFLQDPSNEPGQLAALEEYATNSQVVVSYNGKSFDLPRIKNRYLFHGWPTPFKNIYHIDLLHLTRRLWKNHLTSCSLGDIEYHLLGLERSAHDIPGWQVSEKFLEYLQTGDPAPLEGVFYHNEVDVISLITLLSYITERLTNPLSDSYLESHDLISVGNFLSHINKSDLAIDVLTRAIQIASLSEELTIMGLKTIAQIHKSDNNHALAVPFWEQCSDLGDIPSKVELAKYYEHKISDFEEALHWTLSAKSSLKLTPGFTEYIGDDLDHRLRRLKDKEKNRKDNR